MTTYSCPPFMEVYAWQAGIRSDADFSDASLWLHGYIRPGRKSSRHRLPGTTIPSGMLRPSDYRR